MQHVQTTRALLAISAALASAFAMADSANSLNLSTNTYQTFQVTTPGFTDRVMRHSNGLGYTSPINSSSADGDKNDATFKVEPGLANSSCYSLESKNYPGQFLRHQNSRIKKDPRDGSALFDQDATWCAAPGLSGQGASLQPLKFPGQFLRHQNGELWISADTGGSFKQDATWAVQPPLATGTCTILDWNNTSNYPLGTVVRYNGNLYLEKAVGANGSDATTPTISTYYWAPTSCSGNGAVSGGLPAHILAGYYPNWPTNQLRLTEINANYNLIYLFAATPVGGQPSTTGAVEWIAPGNGRGAATNLVADMRTVRSQGRKVILSIGGAGNNVTFDNRARSQAFIDSVVGIYNNLGGFDGIDWDNYESSDTPNVDEMIWIGQQLKARYPGFIVSSAPAPWSSVDLDFCKRLLAGGALDYCAPQYYDGRDLATQAYLSANIVQWMNAMGPNHLVVGFGVNPDPNVANYWTINNATNAWSAVKAAYPATLGAFDWEIGMDSSLGWQFAGQMKPLVNP